MLDAKLLIHAVLGVVVDKLDTVKLTGTIRIADMRGDHAGLIEIGLRGVALKVHDDVCAVTEIRGRFAPTRDDLALDAVVRPRSGELFGRALHRRIETAGKAAVKAITTIRPCLTLSCFCSMGSVPEQEASPATVNMTSVSASL